jgi:hypothetical protein
VLREKSTLLTNSSEKMNKKGGENNFIKKEGPDGLMHHPI